MTLKPTIEGFIASSAEAEDDVRELSLKVQIAQRDLRRAQTALVGAKERARKAREELRQFKAQRVYEEVTAREVQIAHMKGFEIGLGNELTAEIKAMLRG